MPVTHTVKPGDTLSAIANKYGVTVTAIKAANPFITNINIIQVGWKLDIPYKTTDTVNVEMFKTVLKDIENLKSFKELCAALGY